MCRLSRHGRSCGAEGWGVGGDTDLDDLDLPSDFGTLRPVSSASTTSTRPAAAPAPSAADNDDDDFDAFLSSLGRRP
jgi:hypothetical protein